MNKNILAFEDWLRTYEHFADAHHRFVKVDCDQLLYEDQDIQWLWLAWQHAQASRPEELPRDVQELLSRIFDSEESIKEGRYTIARAWHMALVQARRIKERLEPQRGTSNETQSQQEKP